METKQRKPVFISTPLCMDVTDEELFALIEDERERELNEMEKPLTSESND